MARLGAVVVVMAALARAATLRPLWLALGEVAVAWGDARTERAIPVDADGALGGKGFGDALLRHDGPIDGRAAGVGGLGAQRARGGRVHETRVARVAEAMYDGRLAVVGVGLGVLGVDAAVGARVGAADDDDGRLRARREGAGGGGQRPAASERRLTGGSRVAQGGFYMVRRGGSSRRARRQ